MMREVPIPDYQSLMRPFLAAHLSGQDRAVGEVRAELAEHLGLTDEEQAQLLPSGKGRTWNNRVGWAATYLFRAGLLERPRRSVYRITPRGQDVLQQYPERVDNEVLAHFEEFQQFRVSGGGPSAGPAGTSPGPVTPPPDSDTTPEERIEAAQGELRAALAAELLDRVMEQDFAFFERLVMDVLGRMGYGRGQQLGGSGDEGFDGVIDEDRLGLDRIYVQAKRWSNSVGRPDVQGFVGALAGRGATKGVFITTSTFTAGARAYVQQVAASVVLIDGKQLAELMIEYGVGVFVVSSYDVRRLDLDYFAGDEAVEVPSSID